jgi:PleD family two-component response regulator
VLGEKISARRFYRLGRLTRQSSERGLYTSVSRVNGVERRFAVVSRFSEDDAGVRVYIAQTLLDLGYQVVQAKDSHKALAILSSQPVDLLLTCRA